MWQDERRARWPRSGNDAATEACRKGTNRVVMSMIVIIIIIIISVINSSSTRDSERDEGGQHSWGHCFRFFDRGAFWALPLTYFRLPKSAGAYLFPQSVEFITVAATPRRRLSSQRCWRPRPHAGRSSRCSRGTSTPTTRRLSEGPSRPRRRS